MDTRQHTSTSSRRRRALAGASRSGVPARNTMIGASSLVIACAWAMVWRVLTVAVSALNVAMGVYRLAKLVPAFRRGSPPVAMGYFDGCGDALAQILHPNARRALTPMVEP